MKNVIGEEYKSNSHKSKSDVRKEDKKIEKVATGKVKTKKKSGVNKLSEVFVTEDISSVKDYILYDVLLPAAKKTLSEIVSNGIDMLLYGETKSKSKSRGSKISYSKYYDDREDDYRRSSRRRAVGYDYEDVILESRREAEEVLNRMEDLIDSYGVVSVADLYDLVGISGKYTDNKYGWTNLRDADIERTRDGYLLVFPRVKPL
nr:MAG TPA: replication protein [Caudoviricetes sp.]